MAEQFVTLEDKGLQAFLAKLGDTKKWVKVLRSVASVVAFRDVVNHFRQKQGSRGTWKPRAASTQEVYARKGKTSAIFNPSNELLVLTGNLRQNFLPSNIRSGKDSVTLFNPVEYAGAHDRGEGKLPQREFMWLSGPALQNVSKGFLDQLLRSL